MSFWFLYHLENNVIRTQLVLQCTYLDPCHRIIGFGMFKCVWCLFLFDRSRVPSQGSDPIFEINNTLSLSTPLPYRPYSNISAPRCRPTLKSLNCTLPTSWFPFNNLSSNLSNRPYSEGMKIFCGFFMSFQTHQFVFKLVKFYLITHSFYEIRD